MRVIIAGSRSIDCVGPVYRAIKESGFEITEIVSGTARGVDTLGELWGDVKNIPVTQFKPRWDIYGGRAGLLRNTEMAEYADAAIIVWDGKSTGSKHMESEMKRLGKPYYLYEVKECL